MIKAYGRLGELQTAFSLLDEGLEKSDMSVNLAVYKHLLVACLSDTEAGFKHAIQVQEAVWYYWVGLFNSLTNYYRKKPQLDRMNMFSYELKEI